MTGGYEITGLGLLSRVMVFFMNNVTGGDEGGETNPKQGVDDERSCNRRDARPGVVSDVDDVSRWEDLAVYVDAIDARNAHALTARTGT